VRHAQDWPGFLLLRHGQTDGNKARYIGWADEPLNDQGRSQALAARDRLADLRIDCVYASPFSRTMATAEPLAAARGLTVERRDGLKELNFGTYEGLSKIDHPLKVRFDYARDPIPGGESLLQVAERAMAFMEQDVAPRIAGGGRVAIVSHFWTSRVLLGSLLGLPIDTMLAKLGYKPATGSILAVACETDARGGLRVVSTQDWTPPQGDDANG
jgi:broad specificity phosphatase PhoE